MPNNIRISDRAWEGIKELAWQYGYHDPRLQMRATTSLFNACAKVNILWQDKRPSYASDSDILADQFKLARIWNNGEQRRQMCLGHIPIQYLITLAHTHQIKPLSAQLAMMRGTNLTIPKAPGTASHYAVAGAVLEAIGLRWLAPITVIPTSTRLPSRQLARTKKEIAY